MPSDCGVEVEFDVVSDVPEVWIAGGLCVDMSPSSKGNSK